MRWSPRVARLVAVRMFCVCLWECIWTRPAIQVIDFCFASILHLLFLFEKRLKATNGEASAVSVLLLAGEGRPGKLQYSFSRSTRASPERANPAAFWLVPGNSWHPV